MKFLISKGADATIVSNLGMNPLHEASKFGKVHIVEYLLENLEFDVNQATYVAKNTCLHLACERGFDKIV